LLSNLRNYIYYILGPYKNLNKLLDLVLVAKANTKIKFATRAIIIKKITLIVNKVLTATADCRRYYSKKYKLCELVSVNKFAIRDKTISNTIVFEDTVSY
jgi:hypothetical protein